MANLVDAVHRLADLTSDTSSRLRPVAADCGHNATGGDISKIADELSLLSATLCRLEVAMSPNPEIYTDMFHSDLTEITQELELVLNEISECCDAMHKADTPSTMVPWMFKKGRVTKLHKHLEALKTTLVVMRNVLWEGTNSEKDGNLLGSRAFLEAAIAHNHDTISELYNMDVLASSLDGKPSTMCNRPNFENERPSITCICGQPSCKCLALGDTASSSELKNHEVTYEPHLNRRFSKRGVRLGVHSSILDLGAHNAPEYLRQKWAVQTRSDRQHGRLATRNTNLFTIAESESTMQQPVATKCHKREETSTDIRPITASSWSSISSGVRTDSSESGSGKHGAKPKGNSIGRKVRAAFRKVSHMNLRSHTKAKEVSSSFRGLKGKEKGKERYDGDPEFGKDTRVGKQKKDGFLRGFFNLEDMSMPNFSDQEDTEGSQQSGLA